MSANATVSVRIHREDHAALKEMARRNGGNIVGQIRVLVQARVASETRAGWRLAPREDVDAVAPGAHGAVPWVAPVAVELER